MRVGVLGAGKMGETVIEHLKAIAEVSGIVAYDVADERLRAVRQTHGVAGSTRLRDILDDPAVRLVFVTAANHVHKDLAIQAIEAGKAVLCEKPMANTLADARTMVEAAERRDVFFQIGFELRYSKLYTKVKEWVDAGLLGRVVSTHCLYTSSAYAKDAWRNTRREGGDTFGERISHYVDLTRWWVGAPVTEVYSASAPNVVPYTEVRDNYHNTTDQTRDVVRRVAAGLPPMTLARDAYETMRLCFAAEQSAETGRVVRLQNLPCARGRGITRRGKP